MRLIHLIAVITFAAALSWAVSATAQETAPEEPTEADTPEAPTTADSDVPTEIPEELFESPYMDEIRVIVGPQGQSLYELHGKKRNG